MRRRGRVRQRRSRSPQSLRGLARSRRRIARPDPSSRRERRRLPVSCRVLSDGHPASRRGSAFPPRPCAPAAGSFQDATLDPAALAARVTRAGVPKGASERASETGATSAARPPATSAPMLAPPWSSRRAGREHPRRSVYPPDHARYNAGVPLPGSPWPTRSTACSPRSPGATSWCASSGPGGWPRSTSPRTSGTIARSP
jgi:hypothetical protein